MVKTSFWGVVGLLLSFSFSVTATPLVPTPPCPVATLDNYLPPPILTFASAALAVGAECNVGELGFRNFSFSGSGTGGAIPIQPSAITVTPFFSTGEGGPRASLAFSSPGFSVTGNQSVIYMINYSIDPHPIIDRFFDELDANSPVFPGIASIGTNLCIGAAFQIGQSAQCSGIINAGPLAGQPAFGQNLNVFDNGTSSSKKFDSTSFPLVNFTGVRNTIQLSANGQSSNFVRFINTAGYIPDTLSTPEPSSSALIGFGLVLLGVGRRRVSR